MWLTTINGKEEKMEDISRCFIWFPQFRNDFLILFEEGIIKRIDFDQYEWTKSKTSLAEYFRKLIFEETSEKVWIPGGRWNPIENTLLIKGQPIKRGSLTKLASNNANYLKPDESEDFKKIKELVVQFREKVRQQRQQAQKEIETFGAIKTLIDEADNKDIKKIRTALKK